MTISNEGIQAAHAAICEENFEDCLEWRGKCVKAVEAAAPTIRAEALERAADEFEGGIGVGEFDELSRRDGRHWAHIEDAWEHQCPYMDWLRARALAGRGGE